MAGIQIDGVNNKIDFDDDLDTSISANTDDTLVIEAGGNTMATITATTFTINDGTTITTADNTDTLTLVSTDADATQGPVLNLYRNSSAVEDDNDIARINFTGNDSGGNATTYASTRVIINDVTDGTEDTQIIHSQMIGGAFVSTLRCKPDEIVINDSSIDLDFRVESNGNENALFVNAGDDLIDFGVSGEGHLRPSFYAFKSNNVQTIANNTNTKVVFGTELFDSDSKYSDSRFTPTIAGYYFISSTVSMTNHPQNAYTQIRIMKNGNTDVFQELHFNHSNSGEADNKVDASFVIYLDGDDYLEIFIRQNSGGDENMRVGHECRFMGYRIH